MKREVLRVECLSKKKNGSILKNINLNLFAGELLGVIVRNDWERECLFEILSGGMEKSKGFIYINDREWNPATREEANRAGIYSVGGISSLIPDMSIAENIFLTKKRFYRSGIENRKLMFSETADILRRAEFSYLSPSTKVKRLSPSLRHIIEILKATCVNAKILLIDDITGNYTEAELSRLLKLLLRIKEEGVGILFFSSRYSRLFESADRVVVVRKGTTADLLLKEEFTKEKVLPILAGHALPTHPAFSQSHIQTEVFAARNVHAPGKSACMNFRIKKGEIVGFLDESWRYGISAADMMCGGQPYQGDFYLEGKRIKLRSIPSAVQHGIGLIRESNPASEIFFNFGLTDNLCLLLRRKDYPPPGLIRRKLDRACCTHSLHLIGCDELSDLLKRKCLPRNVSKATQVKLATAKWMCISPKVLVFVNPHMSFDDLTIHEFRNLLEHLCRQGIAVIIFSMSREELSEICDRILVMQDQSFASADDL